MQLFDLAPKKTDPNLPAVISPVALVNSNTITEEQRGCAFKRRGG